MRTLIQEMIHYRNGLLPAVTPIKSLRTASTVKASSSLIRIPVKEIVILLSEDTVILSLGLNTFSSESIRETELKAVIYKYYAIYESLSSALKEFNLKLTSEWTDEQYEIVYQCLEMLQKKFEINK